MVWMYLIPRGAKLVEDVVDEGEVLEERSYRPTRFYKPWLVLTENHRSIALIRVRPPLPSPSCQRGRAALERLPGDAFPHAPTC